jgi:hypothetical protein
MMEDGRWKRDDVRWKMEDVRCPQGLRRKQYLSSQKKAAKPSTR